ncbi:protein TSSC4 [Toxorhynchites rutilus septentrionalis]|uniref:protein TSSC4 n=1 Tax=Toxorhynchites rutilus septentrionalis TaxID=329112 RepID=UPI0024784ED6|nr:protein TSSC4 [Toxorhynchites rutilus septentrionalis]
MSFEEKRKALFASLESAEKSIGSDSILHQEEIIDYSRNRRRTESEDSDRNDSRESPKKPLRKFRGRESIFKRPAAPIAKCLPMSRLPDFQRNPHRWTKHSLEDVDISDRSNTAAAFSFLREIEARKQDEEAKNEQDDSAGGAVQFRGRIKFNRSIKLKSKLEGENEAEPGEEDKPVVKGAKVLMPEYVIGQKVKKVKTVRDKTAPHSKPERTMEMKLGHLNEDDEQDNEDDEMIN